MRLLDNLKARGSSGGFERKVHASGTSTDKISRFCSLLRDDLEPSVAANLMIIIESKYSSKHNTDAIAN